ncbi:MAG: hypothetical protein AAF330_01785, partial [Pseudomonadota bacterium]
MSASEDHITFAELRRASIDHAQAASGDLWTDYNLHDPGVTLLEQTSFALTQVAYAADFEVRDLMTDTEGRFAMGSENALYDPSRVLKGNPVTLSDMNAYFSDLPHIARAWVEEAPQPGFYRITAVPSSDDRSEDALRADITRAFERVRPLCTGLAKVTIARKQRVVLRGEIGITATVSPERIAAELYFAVSLILRGHPYTRHRVKGASRASVFDNPSALLHTPGSRRFRNPKLETYRSVLLEIPGIESITDLRIGALDPESGEVPQFYAAVLPILDGQVGLSFSLEGAEIELSAAAIREEFVRVSAEQISETEHHINKDDWDVRQPGRRRETRLSHVDVLLPT